MLSASGTSSRRFLGRALAASLTLHLLIAVAIPALATRPATRPEIESISFQRVTRLAIERPAAPARPAVRVATVRPRPVVRVSRHAEPVPKSTAPAAAATPAPQRQPPAVVAQSTASPSPVAPSTPAPREVSNVERPPGGYMPFGAEVRDPVLDPNVRKQIEALGARVTLVVSVTDDGRTKDVVFQTPVAHDVQTQIESLLADASWDPAYCGGGIACAGHVTLKL